MSLHQKVAEQLLETLRLYRSDRRAGQFAIKVNCDANGEPRTVQFEEEHRKGMVTTITRRPEVKLEGPLLT